MQKRFIQLWKERFGIIPNLPSVYDNSFNIYELLTWLQRGFKMLLDDMLALEAEQEEFYKAIIKLLQEMIPELIRDFVQSEEFKNYIFNYIREFMNTDEFNTFITNIIRDFINSDEFKQIINNHITNWYNENLKSIIQQIQTDISNIKTDINNMKTDINNLKQDVSKIKGDISNIYNRLTYLENLLKSIIGDNYTPLIENVDYELIMHNDFYLGTNDIAHVGVIESSDRYFVRITMGDLRHRTLTDISQEHNYTPSSRPKSVIFGIRFKGAYTEINTGEYINYQNNGSGIFNTTPKSARASWQASYNLYRNYNGIPAVFVLRSYNDGFNNSFAQDYPDYTADSETPLRLNPGIFNYEFTVLK